MHSCASLTVNHNVLLLPWLEWGHRERTMRDPHHLFSPLPCFPLSSPLLLSSPLRLRLIKQRLKESDIMKIKIKGIMGELLCHMWLLGLPCSLGGDEWLRDNIFYLFIRFSLMNKNRKCGCDHSIAPLVKNMQPLVQTLKNFLFLCFSTEIRDIFHPFSLIYNCEAF